MQGSPATTSMVHDAEEGFHTTLVSKEEGSSPITYDIIMVSLSGSLLLLVVISVAVKVLLRHCTSHYSSKDLGAPAVVLENTAVTSSISDKISTVDLAGPVCVSYNSERHTVSTELASSEETISISELPFFFSVSITPPDSPPEQ